MILKRSTLFVLVASFLLVVGSSVASVTSGQVTASSTSVDVELEASVKPLIDASCMRCHGERTETPLNFEHVGFDLSEPSTFKTWERVFERIESGEMPPRGARKPDQAIKQDALDSLENALTEANLAERGEQRSQLRRLTRLEWEYSIQDLLSIDGAEAEELGLALPAEADSGGFNTVAAKQGISPLHVRSYLDAANRALDVAIQLGPRPATERHHYQYTRSPRLIGLANSTLQGGGAVKLLDDAVATFFEPSSTYHFHSESEGYAVPYPGRYRVAFDAYPYQATSPVTLTMYRGKLSGVAAQLNHLLGSWDLVGDETQTIELTTFLRPGDLIAPSVADLVVPPGVITYTYYEANKNVEDYEGEGIAIKSLTIEGPLLETWPPRSTRELLVGLEFDVTSQGVATIRLTKEPYEHIKDFVARLAPLAFRRPLEDGELEAYAELAKPFLTDESSFLEAVRVPLRGILSSPQFLYHADLQSEESQSGASPAVDSAAVDSAVLDDYALASRLSYFLWRSSPDAELYELAADNQLADEKVLAEQVDRMLDDEKSARFVRDFAGQAFRLYEMKATSPDVALYPEYDSQLGQAMRQETELFLAELFKEDLGVGNLIDSDFTFLNRRLAEHYGIDGIDGQEMRRVELPVDSLRGGLMTQASVLKITSNGTTTSPVPRGNFVLDNLLGQPAPPPPAGTPGLEPDTRGATTIREQLSKHRSETVCNSCHRRIDPPGFALESFDPIGGLRTRYRIPGGFFLLDGKWPGYFVQGPAVDSAGVTPHGEAFLGIGEYKRLLLASDSEQVARNLVSKLIVYATGAEIEFADRHEVNRITAQLAERGYPLRTMVRDVVISDMFRRR